MVSLQFRITLKVMGYDHIRQLPVDLIGIEDLTVEPDLIPAMPAIVTMGAASNLSMQS